jgi:uncharacterized Tic20 family protein
MPSELGREYDREARNTAIAAHVLAALTGPLGPLFVLAETRSEQPFARWHAEQAVAFGLLAAPFVLLTCGAGLLVCAPLAFFAAARAARGEWFSYPLVGRLIR